MQEVAALVREKAPSVTIPSDDLLDSDCGSGGLTGDGLFQFFYYPDKGGPWTIKLSPEEIEAIATGKQREVVFADETPDPWLLPCLSLAEALKKLEQLNIQGLTTRSTKAEILELLGTPDETFGRSNCDPWIKYFRPQCQVLFGFNTAGKLKFVQFYPVGWKPKQ